LSHRPITVGDVDPTTAVLLDTDIRPAESADPARRSVGSGVNQSRPSFGRGV